LLVTTEEQEGTIKAKAGLILKPLRAEEEEVVLKRKKKNLLSQ